MGEKSIGTDEQFNRSVETKGNGNSERNSSSESRNSSRNGSSTTATNGTAGTAGKTEEKKPLGLPILTDEAPAPTPAEPKKGKKRKITKKQKKEETSFNASQISALILTASNIIASREGLEVWALQENEATQLATPIANMIAKSEKLQQLGEHSDAIALVTASMMIFAPRAIIFNQQQKQKKINKNGGVQLVRQKGKTDESSKQSNGTVSTTNQNVDNSIFTTIPSTIY